MLFQVYSKWDREANSPAWSPQTPFDTEHVTDVLRQENIPRAIAAYQRIQSPQALLNRTVTCRSNVKPGSAHKRLQDSTDPIHTYKTR